MQQKSLLQTCQFLCKIKADPIKANKMQEYMHNRFSFYGIAAPERDKLLKVAIASSCITNPYEFALLAWQKKEREMQYIAQRFLRWQLSNYPADIKVVKHLLIHKSWWDSVDEISVRIVGPLVANNTDIRQEVISWRNSENMWLRRASLLYQNSYKQNTDWPELQASVLMLCNEQEFFIRKAIGWALREYAKTDLKAVDEFTIKHKDKLSGLSFSQARKHLK